MRHPAPIPALVFGLSVAALAGALTSQYALGFAPCILCLWQRVPYVLTLALGAYALGPWHSPSSRRLALGLAGLVFLAGAAIAFYHSGVEARWWAGSDGCTANLSEAASVEELRSRLMAAPIVRCDEVPFRVLGLSMAGWNALLSPLFALLAFFGAKRQSL